MDGRATGTLLRSSTTFWRKLRRGPWPAEVVNRLLIALEHLTKRLTTGDEVAAVILFGSYARGGYGRKSDVDLLIVFDSGEPSESSDAGRATLRLCGELETEQRLPMHLAPLLISVDQVQDLGPTLLHAIWTDSIVLHARASALARLQPAGLAPWTLIHFSTVRMPATDRVRRSRQLHGTGSRGMCEETWLRLASPTYLAPGPGGGMTPNCDKRSSASQMCQVSAILPPVIRQVVIPLVVTTLGVAGGPYSAPVCVVSPVQRTTTVSPSAITSSTRLGRVDPACRGKRMDRVT